MLRVLLRSFRYLDSFKSQKMFLWNSIVDTFNYLRGKKARLLITGLDNAGKATLLYGLKSGRISQSLPEAEKLTIQNNVVISTFDVGGHEAVREAMAHLFLEADAIVFLIDAADESRFLEAKDEFVKLLSDEQLANKPILVLGNKMDRKSAKNESEIRDIFNLHKSSLQKEQRPIEFNMCSLITLQGFNEGFTWLVKQIFKFK